MHELDFAGVIVHAHMPSLRVTRRDNPDTFNHQNHGRFGLFFLHRRIRSMAAFSHREITAFNAASLGVML